MCNKFFSFHLFDCSDLCATLKKLCNADFKTFIDEFDFVNKKANVIVAHDTRPSCPLLLAAFKSGVNALNGSLVDYGLLSTPQLHYMVRCHNTNSAYGQPNEEGYFNKLSNAFINIWSMVFESLVFSLFSFVFYLVLCYIRRRKKNVEKQNRVKQLHIYVFHIAYKH